MKKELQSRSYWFHQNCNFKHHNNTKREKNHDLITNMRKKLLSNWKKNLNWRIYELNVYECLATHDDQANWIYARLENASYVLMINWGDVRPFKVSTVNYFSIVWRKLIRKMRIFRWNFIVSYFWCRGFFYFCSLKEQMVMNVKWMLMLVMQWTVLIP